jgi:hypothetical protein
MLETEDFSVSKRFVSLQIIKHASALRRVGNAHYHFECESILQHYRFWLQKLLSA